MRDRQSNITILYLEGDYYTHVSIGEYLENAGFTVIHAYNPYEANQALAEHKIDLLVSDVLNDGLVVHPDFISFIEERVRKGLPIVFFSGGDWDEYPKLENVDFVSKLRPYDLLESIHHLLGLNDVALSKPTVLYFDDNYGYFNSLSTIVQSAGFDVFGCDKLEYALHSLRSEKINVVLTDIDHDQDSKVTPRFLEFVNACVRGGIPIVFLSGMKYERFANLPNSIFVEKDMGCTAKVLNALHNLQKKDARPYILHLDDFNDNENPEDREIFVGLFADLGYRIRSVRYACDALESAVSDPPDLLITDVFAVSNDQCSFYQLTSLCAASDVPIIIFSGANYGTGIPEIPNSRICNKPKIRQLFAEVSTSLAGVSREVLVIDDNPRSRENIAEVLTDAGFKPTTCPTPDHAIDLLRDYPDRFGIVTSDAVFEGRGSGQGINEIYLLATDQGAITVALTNAVYHSLFDELHIHHKYDSLAKLPDTIHQALRELWLSRKDSADAPVIDEAKLANELEILANPISHVEVPLAKFRRKVANDGSSAGATARDMLFAIDLQDLLRQTFRQEMGCGQVCSKRELNAMLDACREISRKLNSKSPHKDPTPRNTGLQKKLY
ncbi:hypothetical protein KKF81_00055 [Candidatus Micrarchaeota archaeon]|nr:hypothetical protein [Candidatus Micrarchaeota archaeon]MBU1165309.1 hypothetical protein [Candidatus Micrarchaeota archaeon]MBU1886135.1 hypothetical protein [Candidatus Micrarchaeota archaeon]